MKLGIWRLKTIRNNWWSWWWQQTMSTMEIDRHCTHISRKEDAGNFELPSRMLWIKFLEGLQLVSMLVWKFKNTCINQQSLVLLFSLKSSLNFCHSLILTIHRNPSSWLSIEHTSPSKKNMPANNGLFYLFASLASSHSAVRLTDQSNRNVPSWLQTNKNAQRTGINMQDEDNTKQKEATSNINNTPQVFTATTFIETNGRKTTTPSPSNPGLFRTWLSDFLHPFILVISHFGGRPVHDTCRLNKTINEWENVISSPPDKPLEIDKTRAARQIDEQTRTCKHQTKAKSRRDEGSTWTYAIFLHPVVHPRVRRSLLRCTGRLAPRRRTARQKCHQASTMHSPFWKWQGVGLKSYSRMHKLPLIGNPPRHLTHHLWEHISFDSNVFQLPRFPNHRMLGSNKSSQSASTMNAVVLN